MVNWNFAHAAFQVETKDALLHAISEQYVEAVEVSLALHICLSLSPPLSLFHTFSP